jgi:hypothetical protein
MVGVLTYTWRENLMVIDDEAVVIILLSGIFKAYTV